ncbi:MAG: aminoglycoside phosphotransferase family protein [Chloroflexi bacterium]|nr:aminoglycoside phosphotransferase family protein [Chloroflexota bacterium]
MANDFLRARHAAYATPETVIFALIKQVTGQQAIRRLPIVQGYDNEVYLVTTERHAEFIVRIRQHGNTSYAQEAWAIEQSRLAGAPVPEVLWVDHLATDDDAVDAQSREVIVQRKAPGQALSERQHKLTPRELAYVWERVGAALGQIHSVAVGGFYKLNSAGQWDYATYDQIMASHLQARRAEAPLLRQAGFSEAEIERMLATIVTCAQQFRCEQPVLCHGDLHPHHLFITDDLRLSAIIDFGEFQGGAPIGDFVTLKMDHPAVDWRWLQAGYANNALFTENFDQQLTLRAIGAQIGYLAYYIQQANRLEVQQATHSLRLLLHALI